jgi:asparagine synthase (glutamine-hydrolysing)
MNGIFGLLNHHAAPINQTHLSSMAQALEYWATAGVTTWHNGPLGLGCAALPATPEAHHENLPLLAPHLGLCLTSGARLDNRAELIADLRLLMDDWYSQSPIANPQSLIPDSLLILLAYQKWGFDCVHHLLGDWHFALWDSTARRLFIARDQHGQTGLYYFQGDGWLAFASGKKALLALPGLPQQPNLTRLAQILTSWPGQGISTAYEGILRLPPGHHITIQAESGQAQIERYWKLEEIPSMQLASDEDYVDGFLDVFTLAVQSRLRCDRSIGVTLSGGLDSGSVSAVAARLLAEQHIALPAYTSIPINDTSELTGNIFGDESNLAGETARFMGNIEHILMDARQITPLAGIQRALALHDEPGHAASNYFWLTAILLAAQARGHGALLTGQGGNATISWAGVPVNLLPLIVGQQRGDFWQAIEREGRAQGINRLKALRRFVFKPLIGPLWQRIKAAAPWRKPVWQAYSAIHPAFARQMNISRQMAEEGHDPAWGAIFDPRHARSALIQPGKSIIGAIWMENGAGYGLEVRDPTFDRRVMEFCVATPEAQFRRDGQDRWLIRRAMQGYLPDSVRLNRRIGLQAADIAQRVQASRDEIQATLDQMAKHPICQQILDLPRMNRVLAGLEQTTTRQSQQDCGTILLRGLGVGLFLLRF